MEKSLVILRLKGGLGNQIFQVTHAQELLGTSGKIFIDCSYYKKNFADDYAGKNCDILKILSDDSIKRCVFFSMPFLISWFMWKLLGIFSPIIKRFNLKALDGYFHDTELLPRELDYNKFFNLDYSGPAFNIDSNSVLIHVRKGDYTNSINSKIYYNCDVDFYKRASSQIAKEIESPKFFVVSNDNQWVRDNFSFLGDYYLLEIDDPIESFRGMSRFSNFIISNSTFSWWAAVMSQSKLVLAPELWFLDSTKNQNLYPKHWKKI